MVKVYSKIFLALIFLYLGHFSLNGQSINNILTQVGNGDYTAQQEVHVKPNSGQVTPSGTGQAHLFIDPTIAVPQPYSASNTFGTSPVNYVLDVSKTVGSIPYEYEVTSIGSAECNIPILTPIGSREMVPELSLTYNSNASKAELGIGWAIGGLQTIGRLPQNLHNNNNITAVDLTNNDVFALNGNRLIPTSGSNGQSGTIYTNEQIEFNKITSFGAIGSGPQWFQVETKNGIVLEFGNTSDSRLIPIGTSTVYEWRLNKMYDKNGNYVSYEYFNSGGELLIKEIKYTGNATAGISPYNTVDFYYNIGADQNSMFLMGGEIKQKSLLRQISVKSEGLLVYQYDFDYTEYFNSSYLTEVKLKGADYTDFNSLKLSYQNDTGNPLFQKTTGGLGSIWFRQYQFLDFTGDGLKDAIAFDGGLLTSTGYASSFIWQDWRVLKNTGNSNFTQLGGNNSFLARFMKTDFFPTSKNAIGSMNYLSYDFNGDNKEDLLFRGIVGNNDFFHIYLSNGSGFNSPISLTIPIINTSSSTTNNFWFIDMNGDQKLDLLYQDNTNNYRVWLNLASGNQTPDHNITFTNVFRTARPFDFEGDGKAELIIDNSSPANTFSKIILNSSNQLQLISIPTTNSYFFNQPNYVINSSGVYGANTAFLKLEGDYNGDAKTDYILSTQIGTGSNPTSYKWELYLNKGDGTYTAPILLNKSGLGLQDHITPSSQPKWFYYNADMNADGKTDIIEFRISNPASTTFKVYFSKGVNGDYFTPETYPIPAGAYGLFLKEMEFGDMDGNGVNDIIMYDQGSAGDIPYIIYFYKGEKSKYIHEISDSYNRKTEFIFSSLSTNPSSPITGITYPVSNFNYPIYLVKETKTSNGLGGLNSITYLYENALFHKRGKGLIGFKKITKTDLIGDVKQVDEYDYDNTHYNLFHTKSSFFNYSSNTLIQDEVFTNSNVLNASTTFWPAVTKITKTNYLQNFPTVIDFGYDANGNTVYDKTNINNGLDVEENYYYSFVSNGSWIPYRPSSKQTIITRSGDIAYIRTVNYTYDNAGEILTETFDPSTPKSVIISNTYDPNSGLQISKNISSAGLPTKNWQYSYDSKNRLVIQETNSLGQTINTQYDFKFGKPINVKNEEGLVTKMTYDGFGRVLTLKKADGNTVQYLYNWVTGADFPGGDPLNISNCLFKTTIISPGDATKTSYYDMLMRELRTKIDGFSNPIYKMCEYNARGNKFKETSPYQLISSNPFNPVITQHTYDNLNRLVQTSANDGTNTNNTSYSYGYNSGDITITLTAPDGKTTSRKTDASGLLKQVTDNGGTINYTYYSNRKSKSIDVNGVQATFCEYDQYGRQTKLVDRDAGTTYYDYNGYGFLNAQTDANNKTYNNFVYDALDRLLSKTGPDGIYNYQYVSSGSGLNMLQQETAPNGYFTKYTYDALSRRNKIEENISGQTFVTEYSYDSFSRIEKQTYPSGFAIKIEYDIFGNCKKVKHDATGQTIWECLESTPFGSISKYLSGNGIQTNITLDNFGLPKQFNSTGVQQLNFSFNTANGNLNSKNDAILGLSENFGYDNMNRLTTTQVASNPAFNVTYNNNGNVLTKTNIGTFTYKSNKIDAVDKVTNPNSEISLNQQDISYTPFNQPQTIKEDIYQYDFFYGPNQQRKKTLFSISGNLNATRFFVGEYEKTIQGAITQEVHYINTPTGLSAIYVITNGTPAIYYTYQDYMGNILKATDAVGNIVTSLDYDPWGRRRNSISWDYTSPTQPPAWLYRGFTEHEHLEEVKLINMNGRLYDPILGMMLSPDRYVQNSALTQNFNRYAYAYNNPLKFKDPDGDFLLLFLLFTKPGYEIQKYTAPMALKLNVSYGSHRRGLGFDMSIGIPKVFPISYRYHFGRTYYWKSYGNFKGWEKREGGEIGLFGAVSISGTRFTSGESSQTLNMLTLGVPGAGLSYENDYFFRLVNKLHLPIPASDGGDRYRTASLSLQVGFFEAGFNMFTGDPGLLGSNRKTFFDPSVHNRETYMENDQGDDPNKYRAGIAYISFMGVQVGRDSEKIRNVVQNKFAHDLLMGGKSPYFKVLDIKPKWYFQFNTGTGDTNW